MVTRPWVEVILGKISQNQRDFLRLPRCPKDTADTNIFRWSCKKVEAEHMALAICCVCNVEVGGTACCAATLWRQSVYLYQLLIAAALLYLLSNFYTLYRMSLRTGLNCCAAALLYLLSDCYTLYIGCLSQLGWTALLQHRSVSCLTATPCIGCLFELGWTAVLQHRSVHLLSAVSHPT